jgi:hypothetical protein
MKPLLETCKADDCNRFKIPPPPGEVIARSSVDCAASAESRFFADVALLENGEVWMVMFEYSGIAEGFQSLFYIAAGTLGVILLLIGGALKLYDGEE